MQFTRLWECAEFAARLDGRSPYSSGHPTRPSLTRLSVGNVVRSPAANSSPTSVPLKMPSERDIEIAPVVGESVMHNTKVRHDASKLLELAS